MYKFTIIYYTMVSCNTLSHIWRYKAINTKSIRLVRSLHHLHLDSVIAFTLLKMRI